MAVGKLVAGVVVAALSIAARLLLGNAKQKKNALDTGLSEPSVRGTLLGVAIGYCKVGAVIGWVGGRHTVEESVDGGGGKGGGPKQEQTVYYERAWHILTVGKGIGLRKIVQEGKNILPEPVSPSTHPSGTVVDLGKEGQFAVYWGRDDQPINSEMAGYMNVSSRFPNVMYVWWKDKRLGTSAHWPNLEYEIVTEPATSRDFAEGKYWDLSSPVLEDVVFQAYRDTSGHSTTEWKKLRVPDSYGASILSGETMFLTQTGSEYFRTKIVSTSSDGGYLYLTLGESLPNGVFTGISSGWEDSTSLLTVLPFSNEGANPAAAMDQMLFQVRPQGAGLDRTWVDEASVDLLSGTLYSEGVPCSFVLNSGKSWRDGVAALAQDMGYMCTYDISDNEYVFPLVRDGATAVNITDSQYNEEGLQTVNAYSVLAPDGRVFTYKDSSRDFDDSTISMHRDGAAQYGADPNVKSIELPTVNSYKPASKVAARRDTELSNNSATSVTVGFDVHLVPGQVVTLGDSALRHVLMSVETHPDDASQSFEMITDAYQTDGAYSEYVPPNPSIGEGVEPDSALAILEPNRFEAPGVQGYFLLRSRGNNQSISATVYHSPDGVSYDVAGDMKYSVAGLSEDAVSEEDGPYIIEDGPVIELLGPEDDIVALVVNLTGDETRWRSGEQRCLIGNEVFYLRNVSAVPGESGKYQLHGLIRARAGTVAGAHAAGSEVFLFRPSSAVLFTATWILAGNSIYAKTTPYSASSITSVDQSLTASLPAYGGGGSRPLPVSNLNTVDDTASYEDGVDMDIRWDYKNATSIDGAGVSAAGEVTTKSPPEGYFTLTVRLTSTGAVVASYDVTTNEFTYTSAQRVSDFGSHVPEFYVEVVEKLNGLASYTVQTHMIAV